MIHTIYKYTSYGTTPDGDTFAYEHYVFYRGICTFSEDDWRISEIRGKRENVSWVGIAEIQFPVIYPIILKRPAGAKVSQIVDPIKYI